MTSPNTQPPADASGERSLSDGMGNAQPRSGKPNMAFRWTVPNMLTVARIIVVPVLAVVLLTHPHDPGWRIGAAALFVAGILTDSLDGYLARHNNQVTNFGKIWDPIADKALTGIAFIGLSIIGELPWWITIIILLREWGITVLRFAILKYAVMAANKGGKLKTLLQSFALTLFLLAWPQAGTWFWVLKWCLMWAAFALTVITGLDYLWNAWKLRKASLAADVDKNNG